MDARSRFAFAVAISIWAILTPPAGAEASGPDDFEVDLNRFPLYVKVGFSPADAAADPRSSPGDWRVLPPPSGSSRIARISDLRLPGMPERRFLSFARTAPRDFAFAIPFEYAGDPPTAVPGLNLPAVGDNWEIYLNGTLVRSELHLRSDGFISGHRFHRDVFFPFDPSLLRRGTNVLALRVVGDPTLTMTGFYQTDPYLIAPYARIEAMNTETWKVSLITLYFFLGLYHLFVFLTRRQDRHNFYYAFFSIDLALYLFARTHTVYALMPDSAILFRIELATLSVMVPFLGAFLETLTGAAISAGTKVFAVFCAVIALGQVFFPLNVADDLLRIWQVAGLAMALFYFGYRILYRFFATGYRRWRGNRGSPDGASLLSVYRSALFSTPLGNLLLGSLILFSTGVFDILDSIFFHFDLVLIQYGFFLFMVGTAMILANRYRFLHDQLGDLNKNLEDRIQRLTDAQGQLSASERKYRSLFEGSAEPIALLDDNLGFKEGNKAAVDFFRLDSPERAPATFYDAIYAEKREGTRVADHLKYALRSRRRGSEAYEATLRLKSPIGEPKLCRVRLEPIKASGGDEILLRLSPESADELSDAFVEGRETFRIESTLAAADEVVDRATANLGRYMGADDAAFLSICLREIVINAVEHGNLEIDFDEKTAAQRSGRYFEFLSERRQRSIFRDRRVLVEYSVTPRRATFRVTDAGKGFDHKSFLSRIGGEDGPDPELLEHGRGLFMTLSAFDQVAYNEAGNQVTLVKNFSA